MLTCRVLGSTEVDAGGVRVPLGGPLPRRVITALIAAEGRPMTEGQIGAAIWAGQAPASPSVSLQSYVSRLRTSLGPFRDALERAGAGYRLRSIADATTFAAHVQRGRMLLTGHPREGTRAFEAALRLWRGTPYAELPDTPWIAPIRARLSELHAVAVEERLAARLAVGAAADALADLRLSLRARPDRERRWELMVIGLHRDGRAADARAALSRAFAMLPETGAALQALDDSLPAADPLHRS